MEVRTVMFEAEVRDWYLQHPHMPVASLFAQACQGQTIASALASHGLQRNWSFRQCLNAGSLIQHSAAAICAQLPTSCLGFQVMAFATWEILLVVLKNMKLKLPEKAGCKISTSHGFFGCTIVGCITRKGSMKLQQHCCTFYCFKF